MITNKLKIEWNGIKPNLITLFTIQGTKTLYWKGVAAALFNKATRKSGKAGTKFSKLSG
jgi:hypothetical protein